MTPENAVPGNPEHPKRTATRASASERATTNGLRGRGTP
jgi:hypothetical protein